jgi:probable phosphoglycerate mutase
VASKHPEVIEALIPRTAGSMQDPDLALDELLIQKTPKPRCGGKALALLSVLVGLSLAGCLSLMSHSHSGSEQHLILEDTTPAIDLRYRQSGRNLQLPQSARDGQLVGPMRISQSSQLRRWQSVQPATVWQSSQQTKASTLELRPGRVMAPALAPAQKQSSMTRLVIVRHGETPWNKIGRVQGQTDIELSNAGILQAETLAQVLRNLGILEHADAVVSSDLARANQTANVIAALCPHAKRYIDPDLGEINFGELQGKFFEEEKEIMNDVYDTWKSGDFRKAFPGANGESLSSVVDRGIRGLRRAADLGPLVVVVSHLNFLKWTSVGIELGAAEPSLESIQDPRVQAVINLPMSAIPNCCYSNVMYDHMTDSFSPQVWFEPLSNPITPLR